MVDIIKPVPTSLLHNEDDASLKRKLNYYRDDIALNRSPMVVEHDKEMIDIIYKILGYRCALEYIEKYGD